jgi:proline iminopeptidase
MVAPGGPSLLLAGLLGLLTLGGQPGCISPEDLNALVPPTADQDPSLPQIRLEIAGHTRAIHVETFGEPSSPVLLVLHGSLADFRALRLFRALADRYFVVMWDQRGNGLSERISAEEYSEQSVVEEIDAMRERFSPGRPVTLLGHSFGAMYAALYTSRHPEQVHQLVLLEPGGLNGTIFQETFSEIININLLDEGMNEMFWQNEVLTPSSHEAMDYRAQMMLLNGRQTNYFCDPEHPPDYPVWRPGAYVEYLRNQVLGGQGAFSATRFDFDFAAGLETFPRRVLFVAGTCSALGPDFQRRHHLPLFRDAELVSIEQAGHRLFVERFSEVLAAIQGYLEAYRSP